MQNFGPRIMKKTSLLIIALSIFFNLSLFGVEPIKIMPLGDSITHENYRDISNYKPDEDRSAYRDALDYLLSDNNYTFDFVGSQSSGSNVIPTFDPDHESYDGETDEGVAANIYDYLSMNPADIVLLHIGTNSAAADNSVADVEFILDEIDRYETTNSTHVKVALARIISCWDGWVPPADVSMVCSSTFKTHINTFNDNIEAMVTSRIASKGDDIIMVDMQNGANFNYDSSDMLDDLHPNDAGYAKMGLTWYGTLEGVIPAHQWKLNETVSPYLDSYRDMNDATCTAPGCPSDVEGVIGQAKLFNGDTNITVMHNASYDWNSTESFSVEFWMKPNYSTNLEVAIGHYHRDFDSWWVGRQGDRVKLSYGSNFIESSANINTSGKRWTHVAVVRNAQNNTLKLYIDGQEDSASLSSIVPSSFDGSDPINIGFFNDGFNFNGALDEITIYNGVLDANQINLHYQSGIDDSVYIRHNWKLDENRTGTGDTYYIDEWNPLTTAVSNAYDRPTQVVGQIGYAEYFDGLNDRLTVSDDPSIDWLADENFTVELWVKPIGVDKEMKFIARRGSPDPSSPLYTMVWAIGTQVDGKVGVYLRGKESSTSYPAVILESPNALTPDTWSHITLVRDTGNTFKLYLDGTEVASAPDTILNLEGNTSMTIGHIIDPDGTKQDYLEGILDDIAIWNDPYNLDTF